MKKSILAAATAKRKMSESENTQQQNQPAKRAALGDLTNVSTRHLEGVTLYVCLT